jgi:hypothetical protein
MRIDDTAVAAMVNAITKAKPAARYTQGNEQHSAKGHSFALTSLITAYPIV